MNIANIAFLKRATERIDDLALRERALLFLAVLAVAYVAAQTLLFTPMQHQRTQLLQQLRRSRQRTETLNLQTQAVLSASGRTPQSKARLQQLKNRLHQMNQQLSALTDGLVSPAQMLGLVRRASAHSPGVTLHSLVNIPAVPAFSGTASTPVAGSGAAPAAVLYRHGLKIVVTGRYPDLVRYLTTLEHLPWKVFWGQVTLKVQRYPVSRLTVVLYTVSGQRGWIGG